MLVEAAPVERPTFGEERTEEQKLYDAAVLERVKRGIALLEREHGPEWIEKINLATLALDSGSHCVLGQIYDDASQHDGYYYALTRKVLPGVNDHNDHEFGFYAVDDDWEPLQAAWENEIRARQR